MAREMNRDEALQVLGLDTPGLIGLTVAGVRATWSVRVRAVHPDTGEDVPNSAQGLARLTEARDTLLSLLAGTDRACKFCGGTGKVRGRLGAQDCTMCRGTGDKQP